MQYHLSIKYINKKYPCYSLFYIYVLKWLFFKYIFNYIILHFIYNKNRRFYTHYLI